MKKTIFILFISAQWIFAGSDEASQKWIAKVLDVYQKAPLSMDLQANMNVPQAGMNMSMKMKGHMIFKDQTHQNMKIDMEMAMPQANPNTPANTTMKMNSIFDGEMMWVEMDVPMLGGKQIMKIKLEQMEQLAAAQGMGGMGMNTSNMDPAKMLESMLDILDFEAQPSEDGKVVLKAKLTESSKQIFGANQSGLDLENGTFMIYLHPETIFPMQLTLVVNDKEMMDFQYTNLKFIEPSDLDENLFKYSPPEGAMVQDLGALLSTMAPKE